MRADPKENKNLPILTGWLTFGWLSPDYYLTIGSLLADYQIVSDYRLRDTKTKSALCSFSSVCCTNIALHKYWTLIPALHKFCAEIPRKYYICHFFCWCWCWCWSSVAGIWHTVVWDLVGGAPPGPPAWVWALILAPLSLFLLLINIIINIINIIINGIINAVNIWTLDLATLWNIHYCVLSQGHTSRRA